MFDMSIQNFVEQEFGERVFWCGCGLKFIYELPPQGKFNYYMCATNFALVRRGCGNYYIFNNNGLMIVKNKSANNFYV